MGEPGAVVANSLTASYSHAEPIGTHDGATPMTAAASRREEVRKLKRMIAMLKDSHRRMLKEDLEPLEKRLANLQAQKSRKRR